MSRLTTPEPVKPLLAAFGPDAAQLEIAAGRLADLYGGGYDYISHELPFDQTGYYEAEMGAGLMSRFFAFERPFDSYAGLVELKHMAQGLEGELSNPAGGRLVNLDPGYVSLERVVLATGKNNIQRIYLGRGVWADLSLVYLHGGFKPLPWTYPNYRAPEVILICEEIRALFKKQRQEN